jgi:hypothetical protein
MGAEMADPRRKVEATMQGGAEDPVDVACAALGIDPDRYRHLRGLTIEQLQDKIAEHEAEQLVNRAIG